MRENIKDRLLSKLQPKVVATTKRKLTVAEEKELEKLLNGYYSDIIRVSRQVKLLQETDDSDLVDSIFAKLEKDFTTANRKDALRFIYELKDKSLIKKFADYSIGVVAENKKTFVVDKVIRDVLFTGDGDLIKKIMVALPPEENNSVCELVYNLDKKFVDIAVEQFSQPQYAGFLPLLPLLDTDYLSEAQTTTIINSITKEGMTGHMERKRILSADYRILPRLAKKIIEVGWEFNPRHISFGLLVLLLLALDNPKNNVLIDSNPGYMYGNDVQHGYSYFMNTVYYLGFALRSKLVADDMHVYVGKFDIR